MAKYKLKALSVQIKEHLYKIENGYIFDTEGKDAVNKTQIELACKAGYLVLIPDLVLPSETSKPSIEVNELAKPSINESIEVKEVVKKKKKAIK